ncbi:hypothetical protein [Angustibacter luteus]|uniref:Uncharacterized protein n=1 Tax=Angustibacter luteus TaxID=658456 RepID=A0ABW1JI33_9ACTN
MHAHVLTALLATRIRARLAAGGPSDRGDVPGWVLVTVMTAGLVAGLWAVAGDTLNDLFRDSIRGVAP